MPERVRRALTLCWVAWLLLAGAGCSSRLVPIAPPLPERFEDLGPAEGRACGYHILLLPFGLNTRIERAYRAAVAGVPGARALRDVTLVDRWNWILIGNEWCATVTGTAVR